MKKLLFGFLLLFSVLFQSCSGESTEVYMNPNHRFQVVYTQHHHGLWLRVLIDKESGEQFLLIGSGSGYGLTKL